MLFEEVNARTDVANVVSLFDQATVAMRQAAVPRLQAQMSHEPWSKLLVGGLFRGIFVEGLYTRLQIRRFDHGSDGNLRHLNFVQQPVVGRCTRNIDKGPSVSNASTGQRLVSQRCLQSEYPIKAIYVSVDVGARAVHVVQVHHLLLTGRLASLLHVMWLASDIGHNQQPCTSVFLDQLHHHVDMLAVGRDQLLPPKASWCLLGSEGMDPSIQ